MSLSLATSDNHRQVVKPSMTKQQMGGEAMSCALTHTCHSTLPRASELNAPHSLSLSLSATCCFELAEAPDASEPSVQPPLAEAPNASKLLQTQTTLS